ncbi:MAG: sugar ABC transporter ATP-binding protein [Phycisphaerales bacterium]|nr:MAG: sugar ABC transporter ATP-binding protein [Phycisphaerales bacterium]
MSANSSVAPAPRVRFDQVGKRFPGVLALDAVSFDVRPGCVHALVGENGAGKSTLVKILAGAHPQDAGTILLDGEPVAIRDARHAQQLGVAIVYQEFNLAGDLTVSENVSLGRWPRRRWSGLIRYRTLHAQAARIFAELAVDVPVRATVASLSVAQQQMVEIGKALSLDARVLVLDEPSAVLTPRELDALFRLVRDLAARGVSIVYISHRLDEIFELADFVTVLRDGRHISTRPITEVDRNTLITETVGRPLEQEFPRRDCDENRSDVALSVRRLTGGPFRNVSFDIRAGEVFALTGLVGSGRSSVAKAVFGAAPVTAGEVIVGGDRMAEGSRVAPPTRPANSLRRTLQRATGFSPRGVSSVNDATNAQSVLPAVVGDDSTLDPRPADSSVGHAANKQATSGGCGSARAEARGSLAESAPADLPAGRQEPRGSLGDHVRSGRRCFRTPREAMRAGVAMLPEDRKREGLLLERPLRENITLAHREDAAMWGLLLPGRERRLAGELMTRHGVKAASTEVRAATLSGGNQQKAMLARWLARPYRVVILDEPTRGVDVGAKVEIYEKLNRIAESGAAVMMISSELPEVIGMADRIGVMCEGRLVGILDNRNRNVSQEAIMRLAVGITNGE